MCLGTSSQSVFYFTEKQFPVNRKSTSFRTDAFLYHLHDFVQKLNIVLILSLLFVLIFLFFFFYRLHIRSGKYHIISITSIIQGTIHTTDGCR